VHLCDHVKLRLQQIAEKFCGLRMVFGEEQAWVSHGLWNAPESRDTPGVREWRDTETPVEKLLRRRRKITEENY
jgi:hypothetical protein